jgi:hypothetical protein
MEKRRAKRFCLLLAIVVSSNLMLYEHAAHGMKAEHVGVKNTLVCNNKGISVL